MSSSSIGLSENLLSYLHESGVKENKFQKRMREMMAEAEKQQRSKGKIHQSYRIIRRKMH